MKIYDISQEVFSCAVFPGDPAPKKQTLASMKEGSPYNLISFSMCAHNGTHVDAPYHFIDEGERVHEIDLSRLVGYACVFSHSDTIGKEDAENMLVRAHTLCPDSPVKILVKGNAELSLEGAEVFANAKIDLYGNESQTVGPENAPMAVHKVMLGASVILLEGIRLSHVPEGKYLLSSAPLNLKDAEGSPCRAVLIEL